MFIASPRYLIALLLISGTMAQDRAIVPISVQRRMALVIGNAAYQEGALKNPVNDAEDLSASLRRLGFDVAVKSNLGKRGMEQALTEFTRQLRTNDLAVFYFSGHGVQVQNENFLVPVDFQAEAEADVEYAAIPASRIRKRLEETGARVRVLILDACRNNPYKFSRDLPGGLAAMTNAAEGTIIAFAANDNQKADDNRAGRNGLYTKHLLEALERPGLSLRDVFDIARAEVYQASGRKQLPALYDTVVGRLVLKEGTGRRAEEPVDAANEAYGAIRNSKDPALFDRFAEAFPNHPLASTARLQALALRGPLRETSSAVAIEPIQKSGESVGRSRFGLGKQTDALPPARRTTIPADDLNALSEAIARGEKVVRPIKYNSATYPYVYLHAGVVTVSKTSVAFRPTIAADHFTVSPEKLLELTNQPERASRVRLRVAIKNKKGNKEDKKEFYFYNPQAVTVGNGPGGTGLSIECRGCDDSMNILYALLTRVRDGN